MHCFLCLVSVQLTTIENPTLSHVHGHDFIVSNKEFKGHVKNAHAILLYAFPGIATY